MTARCGRSFAGSLTLVAAVSVIPVAPSFAADKVSLAYTQTLYSAQIIIAREKGFFAKRDLDVDFKLFTAGRLTLDAVMAGAVDMCATAETPNQRPIAISSPAASRISARSAPGVSIGAVSYNRAPMTIPRFDEDMRRFAHKAVDAIFDHVRDVEKRPVVDWTPFEELRALVSLGEGSGGLKPADATYVNLRPEDMPGALANGSVDAINTWQPHIANAERLLGAKAKVLDTAGIYNETWDLVMMQDYLRTHERQTVAMLRALLDAEAFIHDNRAETIDILSKVVGVERSVVESSWSSFEFRIALDPGLVDVLEAHSRWRLASGNLPQGVTTVPDFRKVIFSAPLSAADPKRVTGF